MELISAYKPKYNDINHIYALILCSNKYLFDSTILKKDKRIPAKRCNARRGGIVTLGLSHNCVSRGTMRRLVGNKISTPAW